MAMSRKHYEMIAGAFNNSIYVVTGGKPEGLERIGATNMADDLIDNLSMFLKMDNPNFDGVRFREACVKNTLMDPATTDTDPDPTNTNKENR